MVLHSRCSAWTTASVFTIGSVLVTSTTASELGLRATPRTVHSQVVAACQAWGAHVRELIDQHRDAGDLAEEDLHTSVTLLYAAEAYCSLGYVLESLEIYERISLERVKRPAW